MRLLLLIILSVFLVVPAFSQDEKPFNADSLFVVARQQAMDGQYAGAIEKSQQILSVYPDYVEVRLLLARIYAWQKEFEPARENIQLILDKEPVHYEANSTLVDFYFWEDNREAALKQVEQALVYYPEDLPLLTQKARILLSDKDYRKAQQVINTLEKLDAEPETLDQLKKAAGLDYSHIVRLEHYFDGFDDPYKRRWHMSSLGYGYHSVWGDFYGKVYVGDMVGSGESLFSDGVSAQYALELYPKIDEKNYMFLNYSWSDGDNFPQNRAGIEFYHVFKYDIEASLGYRYLNFPDAEDQHIHIYTGSLGKYLRRYWISFRPFIIYDGTDISSRYMLSVRNYLNKEDSYVELVLGTGISPDNPYFYTSGETIPNLSSWRMELEWKQKISDFLIFELEGGYENAEYQNNKRRNQFSVRTAFSFLF